MGLTYGKPIDPFSCIYTSTGTTYFETDIETDIERRERQKSLIKSMIGDDKYLLQEIITEIRREKLKQLKNKNNNVI